MSFINKINKLTNNIYEIYEINKINKKIIIFSDDIYNIESDIVLKTYDYIMSYLQFNDAELIIETESVITTHKFNPNKNISFDLFSKLSNSDSDRICKIINPFCNYNCHYIVIGIIYLILSKNAISSIKKKINIYIRNIISHLINNRNKYTLNSENYVIYNNAIIDCIERHKSFINDLFNLTKTNSHKELEDLIFDYFDIESNSILELLIIDKICSSNKNIIIVYNGTMNSQIIKYIEQVII